MCAIKVLQSFILRDYSVLHCNMGDPLQSPWSSLQPGKTTTTFPGNLVLAPSDPEEQLPFHHHSQRIASRNDQYHQVGTATHGFPAHVDPCFFDIENYLHERIPTEGDNVFQMNTNYVRHPVPGISWVGTDSFIQPLNALSTPPPSSSAYSSVFWKDFDQHPYSKDISDTLEHHIDPVQLQADFRRGDELAGDTQSARRSPVPPRRSLKCPQREYLPKFQHRPTANTTQTHLH